MRGVSADFLRGGLGTDKAVVDAADADARTSSPSTVPPRRSRPRLRPPGSRRSPRPPRSRRASRSLKLSCPAGTSGCTGSVSLFTTKTIKVGKLKAQLLLGRQSYSLKAGETKTIKVKLASGTAKLAKKKKLAVSAVNAKGTTKVTLRF